MYRHYIDIHAYTYIHGHIHIAYLHAYILHKFTLSYICRGEGSVIETLTT